MSEVERVLVFEKSGVPRVMFDFTDNKLIVDEVLLSGFLSAIDGFSENLFQNTASHFVIDHGGRKITLFRSESLILTTISTDDLLEYKDKISELLIYFEKQYVKEGEFPDTAEDYQSFRLKLIRILFNLPISLDWIPKFRRDDYSAEILVKEYPFCIESPFCENIDGTNSINDIIKKNSIMKDEAYEMLNYLAFEKVIFFDNSIESRDYIKGSIELLEAFHGNVDNYEKIDKKVPLNLFNQIADKLEYFNSVHALENCSDHELTPYLRLLLENKLIELVDEDRRGILVIADLIADFISLLYQVDKPRKVTELLKLFLDTIQNPMIKMKFNLNTNPISLRRIKILPKTQSKESLIKIRHNWVKLLQEIIQFFYKQYKKKLNEKFYKRLTQHYLDYLHNEDLELLEPILFEIESACID